MDIEGLRSLIAFVETGSFTGAGKQVHRSQSAISQQMKKLEDQTGKALFHRTGRQQGLTEAGKFLLSYARHIISLHDEALTQLKKSKTVRPLYLGCPDDYASSILPQVIALIASILPDLPVHIYCQNSRQLRKMLNDGEIDMAIVTRHSDYDNGYLLCQDKGIWAFNGDAVQLAQLIEGCGYIPLVIYDESCHFHGSAVQGLSRLKIPNKVRFVSSSLTAIQSLVLAGCGISAIAKSSLGQLQPLTERVAGFALPHLPNVTIDLIVSANTHPNFGRSQVETISQQYQQLHQCTYEQSA